jgi:hypothetical protein
VGAAATARHGARVQLKTSHRAALGIALGAGFAALALAAAAATGYLDAVRRAESLLERPHVSAGAARHAESALAAGVGCSQPEISSDLTAKPPAVDDARRRLQALERALSNPPAPQPGAESTARSLAGHSPYQREQPESPGDLFSGWLQGREAALQAAACAGVLSLLLSILEDLAIAAAGLAAAIVAFRQIRGRSREASQAEDSGPARRLRSAEERFAAADRLAAAGDFGAALRELAGAVATVLGGEATWEASPLTVRELYARAGVLGDLRPLLRAFEDSVYGHRQVTRDQYGAAAAVAAPYRPARRRAA